MHLHIHNKTVAKRIQFYAQKHGQSAAAAITGMVNEAIRKAGYRLDYVDDVMNAKAAEDKAKREAAADEMTVNID